MDGVLRETLRMPAHVAPVVVSRVKVMARLDIAERRLPQDGRIGLTLGGKLIDVRVSTLPSRAGERVVLRILDKENAGIDLEMLGMAEAADGLFRDALAEPNGIVLVTGPTGSGKTTTLYAGLKLLNDGTRNILTVEDPVEYAVDGVGQTQINPQVGLTFAAGLRAILRQDPDVVMVGEIRDRETADIAVQAALTGHLVLSTVHTNDAVGAITRLRDMKVEPFLIASTVRAVLAQRLVRRLCPECRAAGRSRRVAGRRCSGIAPGTIVYEPNGCAACGNSGYKGRIGLFEAVRVDDEIRRLINAGADEVGDRRPRLPQQRHPRPRRRGRWCSTASPAPRRRCGCRAARRPMPDFAYVGLDTAGRERRGSVRAETSRRRARPARLAPALRRPDRAGGGGRRAALAVARPVRAARRLGAKQLTLFTRQLATLVTVAPLEEALRTVSRQAEREEVRRVLGIGPCRRGRRPPARRRDGRASRRAFRRSTGRWSRPARPRARCRQILERLANLLERQAQVRGKVLSTLAYPIILAIVAAFVVFALMIFVVPKVVEQFEDIGQPLPLLTRIVIGLSNFLAAWWWALLLGRSPPRSSSPGAR